MSEYLIKRNFLGKPLYFLPTFEEVQPILDFEQIVTIVPNNMPRTALYPVELIIDLDTQKVSYEIVCSISNRLEKWLNKKGFYCLRRLTGSWYAGQYFILPINWTEPYILTGSDSSIEVYKRKYSQHILCDSVRSMAVLLSLAFQIENQDLAPCITTRVFDAYSRHNRILFDTTSNSMNRGRRSNLSLHQNSLNLCVPFNSELPSDKEELFDIFSLENALNGELVFNEPDITSYMQNHNTKLLLEIINQYERIYHDYFLLPRMRFEEMYFKMKVNQL